jgi:hypothetical protein
VAATLARVAAAVSRQPWGGRICRWWSRDNDGGGGGGGGLPATAALDPLPPRARAAGSITGNYGDDSGGP